MSRVPLYPMRFDPLYEYRLWGGRRLAGLLDVPLPNDGPFGEAWILSDREDHSSVVADGPLKGQTIRQLIEQYPEELLGGLAKRFQRFPLLLKFLDAHEMLSVQVHPGYSRPGLPPANGTAKTEAWVVLEAGKESRIDAGLKAGTTADILRESVANNTLPDHLVSIAPKPGDGVFIPAGTVHSLGGDVVVFEVQQNSDVTYRLYDWCHLDAKTGKPRELEVDKALACIDFVNVRSGLVTPQVESEKPVERERLFDCNAFRLWRLHGQSPFTLGAAGELRLMVCVEGAGQIAQGGATYPFRKGGVWLLPAVAGPCMLHPDGIVTMLEISIPDGQGMIDK
jgi:mannose-6-phosphate isomerase